MVKDSTPYMKVGQHEFKKPQNYFKYALRHLGSEANGEFFYLDTFYNKGKLNLTVSVKLSLTFSTLM